MRLLGELGQKITNKLHVFVVRGNNSKNLSLSVRLDSPDVDALCEVIIQFQLNCAIGVDLSYVVGTLSLGVQFVGLEHKLQSLLAWLIIKGNALGIGSYKILFNEQLSSLTEQLKVHYEWDVQNHVTMEGHRSR